MDVLKRVMPIIAVITIIVCAFIKRKEIKEMFSDRPIFSSVLILLGIAIIMLLGFFVSSCIIKV